MSHPPQHQINIEVRNKIESIKPNLEFASKIVAYYDQKAYTYSKEKDHYNIFYVEGMNLDFTLNKDRMDEWNDLRGVFAFNPDGVPYIVFLAVCTTEPGYQATMSPMSKKVFGVARIKFGQFTAWRMGLHRKARSLTPHPALVQFGQIPVHRDFNRDGLRIGDAESQGYGINQHGTRPGYIGGSVSNWSAGCLVGQWWPQHIQFINLLKMDSRYISNNKFVFTTAIIAGDDFEKSTKAQ